MLYKKRIKIREKSNRDIFNFFLLSSDPVITSKHKPTRTHFESLPKEALALLEAPTQYNIEEGHDDDNSESEDDDALAYF